MAAPTAPAASTGFSVNDVVLTPVTFSVNVAVGVTVVATPVAPPAGVRALTVGRGPVMNVAARADVGSGLPARSLTALVSETVYLVSLTSAAACVSVATCVVAL